MRVSGPSALGLLLAAVLLAAMLPSGQAVPDDPDNRWADIQGIKAGDYWDFRVTGQENGEIHNEVIGVTKKANDHGKVLETYLIRATGELESRQRPRDVTGTGVQPSPQPVDMQVDIKKWVRTTDYAVHQIEGITVIEGGARAEVKESFDPPLIEAVYPFQEGYKWRSWSNWRLEGRSEEPSYSELSDLVTVEAKERITVPAGSFDTWRLRFDSGRDASEYKIQWYSEETCDIVKEERHGQEGLINTMELLRYRCSQVPKDNPTYDPEHVALLAVGEMPQGGDTPGPAFLPATTNESGGLSMWWVALGLVVVAGGVMVVVKRRG